VKFPQNGIGKRRRPCEEIEGQNERKFEAKERQDDAEPAAGPPFGNIRRCGMIGSKPDHFIDDELADI
jgi:hypothetical protein